MDTDAHRPNVGRPQSSTLAEREPGFLSGLASLLPRLGYTGVLPNVTFERQERPLAGAPSLLQSRASSVGSDGSSADSEAFRRESTALPNTAYTDQPETSTSGRNSEDTVSAEDSTAAAAERHRLGTGSNVDLQVTISSGCKLTAARNVSKVPPEQVLSLTHAGHSTLGGKDGSVFVATVRCFHIYSL